MINFRMLFYFVLLALLTSIVTFLLLRNLEYSIVGFVALVVFPIIIDKILYKKMKK
jgi:membrane protein implicated in regulation of membrane protease activity